MIDISHLRILEQGPFLTSFLAPNSESMLYYVASRQHTEGWTSSAIYRNDPLSNSGTELANVTYFSPSTTRVQFGSKAIELDAFLRRRSTSSNSRIFVGPNGHTYKWRINGKNLELHHLSSRTILARSRKSRAGQFSWKSRSKTLELELAPKSFDQQTLDAVVVTFVIMQHLLRERLKYGGTFR